MTSVMKYELGIDEAGRGPVLGPMVLAGVLVPEDGFDTLIEWGVKDSKGFGSSPRGQQRRADLARRIMDGFQCRVVVLSTGTIDAYVREHSLNVLEQQTAREIIAELPADSVILDGQNLFNPLTGPTIKAENKADDRYLSVAAASILAKWKRDLVFGQLCREFEDLFGSIRGGGYANAKTLEFVKWYLERYGELPAFYRKSYRWKALESD